MSVWIEKEPGKKDARETVIKLTIKGKALTKTLKDQWQARFTAIEDLEKELAIPIRNQLEIIAAALEEKDFSIRIDEAFKKSKKKRGR